MPRVYYIDNPDVPVPMEDLQGLGVFHWKLDADNFETDPVLKKICEERGYNYRDFVHSAKIPNLQEKLAIFFEEHIHEDEEIRFFLEGSGFFDVRDGRTPEDRWLRIVCEKGDMIILPAGIYHRFNPDDKMFFHVMRLFCGDPVWTPFNRVDVETDKRVARQKYVNDFLRKSESN